MNDHTTISLIAIAFTFLFPAALLFYGWTRKEKPPWMRLTKKDKAIFHETTWFKKFKGGKEF